MEKRCSKCGKVKPVDEFRKGGTAIWCNQCGKEYDKDRYQRNRQKFLDYQREYSKTEKGRAVHKKASRVYTKRHAEEILKRAKTYYDTNRDKVRDSKKRSYQKHRDEFLQRQREFRETKEGKEYGQNKWRKYYKKHSEVLIRKGKDRRLENLDKYKARDAINKAVVRGKIPPPSSFICEICKERPAREYHHFLGYAEENRLKVIPVCSKCHHAVDKK